MPTPPTVWNAPTSVPTVDGGAGYHSITYGGGYWFSLTRGTYGTRVRLRVTQDPTGTWTEVTLPGQPTGYTASEGLDLNSGVVYDGNGTWAFGIRYLNSGGTSVSRIVYSTAPTSTWTAYQYDTTNNYRLSAFNYGDGKWVVAGRYYSVTPGPAYIGYSTAVAGTYTFGTADSAHGYDIADLGGSGYWDIGIIGWGGSSWITTASRNTGGAYMRTSTSLTSGWSAPSSFTMTDPGNFLTYHSSGYWTLSSLLSAYGVFATTNSPTGTWTNVGSATHLLADGVGNIAYDGSSYLVVGSKTVTTWSEPGLSYLQSAGSPDAAFTAITGSGFTDPASADAAVIGCAYASGYFVAGSEYNGEIRYCYLPVRTTTYLRQRQSPVRTPSRVSGVDLRQRQTPVIRS